MHTYASQATEVKETENIKRNALKGDDRKNVRIRNEVERSRKKGISLWNCNYSKTVLHTRKCIQHHSPAIEETEIEKGKSEFAHLGNTSHWRQSISNSMLLKRAWWKYFSSQQKRSWHTFQSIGYSECAGIFLQKKICLKLGIVRDGDTQERCKGSFVVSNYLLSLSQCSYNLSS